MSSTREGPPGGRRPVSPERSVTSLMHSLEVHQQELEVQNDQLRTTNDELRISNDALVVSRDRFRALYNFAPIPYVTIDQACIIFDVNRAAELMLDSSRDHLIGGRFDLFVAAENLAGFAAFVASVFTAGAARSVDVSLVREAATAKDVLVDGVVVPDEPSPGTERAIARPPRCVLAIVDITLRKRAEAARRQAQEEVLAIVAHDLRGPLNAI